MMFKGTNELQPTDPKAKSFASLMELYELNYMWLRRLIPNCKELDGHVASHIKGALDLHMEVLERCKYTTTLSLTYRFDDIGGYIADPDVRIRIYHDARTAEVMACSQHRLEVSKGPKATAKPDSLEWKWNANRFLLKWLRFCVSQGHTFDIGIAIDKSASDVLTPT